ncbi:TonB-linked outer membrane protein, SusC/RagA family [Chitinophaga sp. YR573]|nr:TonB-linked outer membrane protein, SusC/RagA family [Chitinophaga sp. YR573]
MKKGVFLCLLLPVIYILPAIAQIRTLTGKVTSDSSGAPLPGVTVRIKGSTYRIATGEDGTFSIPVGGAQELIFSMVGYANKQLKADAATTWLDVRLKPDQSRLSEVVVVGYGQQTQRYTTEAVSVLKSDVVENVPAITPQQLLQGQAAGVQMTNSSGLLGAASLLRIRGAASITAGGQPLFVVDGVPLSDGQYSTLYSGGAALNPLLELNPDDFESITILKDAAAAAIYGSRGSNGVVLIKTKRGATNSKTKVQLDYYTGWAKPTNTLKVLNADEYRNYYNDYITKVTGRPTVDFPAKGFDWADAVKRTGKTNNYSLSASGGNDKTKFYLGGSYLNQESFVIGNDLKKLTGRLNLEHSMSKRVHFGVNFTTAYTDMDRILVEGDLVAPFTAGYLNTPFTPAYTDDGQFADPANNALAVVGLNRNKYYTRRNTGNAYATINITDHLWIKSDWGIDQLQTEERYRRSEKITPGGAGGRTIWQDNKWLTTNSLNYEKNFTQDHHIELLAAHSFETARYDDIKVSGSGFTSDKLLNVGSASVPVTTSATGKEWALESYIFRANYRYKDKYMAEASFRRDGSSRFGSNKKYGDFWAVSAGWVISQEQFMRSADFINYLKLTASYGVTGNDRIGYYDYLALYTAGTDANYAGQPGLRPTQASNPNLGWESTGQLNIGLAANALDNRLQLNIDYYRKNSKDVLLYVAFPSTTGFGYGTKNSGKMQNNGVDLQITGVVVKNKDFEWTTSLNAGYLKNIVTQLPSDTRDEEGRNFIIGSYNGQRAIQGYSLNSFYLIRYKGINAETGDPEWYTKDGKATTAPTSNDQVIAGSALPKFTGGFNNTFRYKHFDLGINFYFSTGNKVMLSEFQYLDNPTYGLNVSKDLLNYWKQPGDKAFAPSATSASWSSQNNIAQVSTAQLFDGSYLRLKTLTLGYNLPAALLSNTHVLNSARVYVLGQNLWTATKKGFRGADPEVSGYGSNGQVAGESFFSLPQPKTITIGVNLVF